MDIFFPPYCVNCGRGGSWFCSECRALVKRERDWQCVICDERDADYLICSECRDKVALDGIVAVSRFDPLMQKLVHSFKYKYVEILGQELGDLLAQQVREDQSLAFLLEREMLLVPVPLYAKRFAERGFNQSELLARHLAESFDNMSMLAGLVRTRETHSQMELDRSKRLKNVKGAFEYQGQSLEGKFVLLIDDVTTTASTLLECAKVLKQAKAEQVWGLVMAHG